MPWRRQVTVAGLAGSVLLLGAVVAAGPSGPDRQVAPRPSTASPTAREPPVVLADCWVPTEDGTVSLTAAQAQGLTTAAASAGRQQLQAAVEASLDAAEPQVAVVTASLRGDPTTQRLTCSHARLSVEPEDMTPSGLTPRARRLRAAWTEVFGALPDGGFARGGVSTGHVDSSSHYDGRAVDVFFRPHTDPEQRRSGRVFAQWLVAHAQELSILSVIYADQIWTSWAAPVGWREYVHPSGNTTNPVLRHLDHVHVAVESGKPYRG